MRRSPRPASFPSRPGASASRIAAARSPFPRSASRRRSRPRRSGIPDFAKRKVIQADLRQRLPGLSINMGGATSIDITREGVDKAYGLKKLSDASGIALDAMMFVGDAIFPGGNDYPAKELGLDTVRVRDPEETLAVIATVVACQHG